MLTITVQGDELWDEEEEVFKYTEPTVLQFEHSLVSLSKWESKFHKLFLTKDAKSDEEMLGYVQAMLVTPDAPPDILNFLKVEDFQTIDAYINDPMTGTTIAELPAVKGQSSERISSELIYFWMSSYQIDKECEHWHLNRLFTLIKIHYAKSQKPKKMNTQERVRSMAEINAERKKRLGTSG